MTDNYPGELDMGPISFLKKTSWLVRTVAILGGVPYVIFAVAYGRMVASGEYADESRNSTIAVACIIATGLLYFFVGLPLVASSAPRRRWWRWPLFAVLAFLTMYAAMPTLSLILFGLYSVLAFLLLVEGWFGRARPGRNASEPPRSHMRAQPRPRPN